MIADRPLWAARLRDERNRRLWSQKETAVRLRNAADEQTRARLPDLASIQRYVRDYEAGKHRPGDLYMALYCQVFGLSANALFSAQSSGLPLDHHPTEEDAANLTAWIESTNTGDDAVTHLAEAALLLAEAHTQLPRNKYSPTSFAFIGRRRCFCMGESSDSARPVSCSVSTPTYSPTPAC